jgi:hypothetical protein
VTATPGESPFAGRAVIVLAGLRTGSTWLSELLLSHPELAGLSAIEINGQPEPAESGIFGAVSNVWLGRARVDGEGINALVTDEQIAAAVRRFCDGLFARARDSTSPDAKWFVEKTPDNVKRVPMLSEIYPDGWYVHLVRDGRDVARSVAEASFGTDDVAEAAATWATEYRWVSANAWRLRRFRQIRYEQLLADPVGTMTAVFDWMSLPVDDSVLERLHERAGRAVARFGKTTPVGEGKWRLLPDADLERIYAAAGDVLAELGYLRQSS